MFTLRLTRTLLAPAAAAAFALGMAAAPANAAVTVSPNQLVAPPGGGTVYAPNGKDAGWISNNVAYAEDNTCYNGGEANTHVVYNDGTQDRFYDFQCNDGQAIGYGMTKTPLKFQVCDGNGHCSDWYAAS